MSDRDKVSISVEALEIMRLTEDDYSCSFGSVRIWSDGVEVGLFIPTSVGTEEDAKKCAVDLVPLLERELAWLEASKKAIVKEMAGDRERAEEWTRENPEYVEVSDDEGYVDIDGERVSLPITEEAFEKSLFLWAATYTLKNIPDSLSLSLELGCFPEYFEGHRLHVEIDEHKNIVSNGI